MYRVPLDLDLGFCIGSALQQVCVGKFDVQFLFTSGAKVAVQGNVALRRGSAVVAEWSEGSGWSSLEYHALLDESVLDARVAND